MAETGSNLSLDDLKSKVPDRGKFSVIKNWWGKKSKLEEPLEEYLDVAKDTKTDLEKRSWYSDMLSDVEKDRLLFEKKNDLEKRFDEIKRKVPGIAEIFGRAVKQLNGLKLTGSRDMVIMAAKEASLLINSDVVVESAIELKQIAEVGAELDLNENLLKALRGDRLDLSLQADLDILHEVVSSEKKQLAFESELSVLMENSRMEANVSTAQELADIRNIIKRGETLAVTAVAELEIQEGLLLSAAEQRDKRKIGGADRSQMISELMDAKAGKMNPDLPDFVMDGVDVEEVFQRVRSLVKEIRLSDDYVLPLSLIQLGGENGELQEGSVLAKYTEASFRFAKSKEVYRELSKNPETAVKAYLVLNQALMYGSEMSLLEDEVVMVVKEQQYKALLTYLSQFEVYSEKARFLANRIMALQQDSAGEKVLKGVATVAGIIADTADKIRSNSLRSMRKDRAARNGEVSRLMRELRGAVHDADRAKSKIE